MPTYEYACPECSHEFEVFHSITGKPIKKCPECGGRRVKRLISMGGGVIFKGSGFYQTDYVRKSGTPEPKSEDKPAAKETSKDKTSTAANSPADGDTE